MVKQSGGIVMYRRSGGQLRVLLVHPGGPYWRAKDEGSWSIPKGEPAESETMEQTARREFEEELGMAPVGRLSPLGSIRQIGGKVVTAFALEGDFAVETLRSNRTEIEWPPRSGKTESFPEVDRAAWFTLAEAQEKILASQRPLLDALEAFASANSSDGKHSSDL